MEKTANQIQKERTRELENKANELIKKCDVATLTSINEKGYPRTCVISIAKADSFSDIYLQEIQLMICCKLQMLNRSFL